jgi:hypothetical protein
VEPGAFVPTDRYQRQDLVLLHSVQEYQTRIPTAMHVFIVHLLEIPYEKPYY